MAQPPQEPQWPTYQSGTESAVPDSPVPGLPAVPPPATPVPSADPHLVPPRPGYTPQDPLVLAAGGSTLRKEGVWTVPPYMRVHGDLGTVKLDFRRAVLTSQVVWMDVSGGAGTIVMVIPEGWGAQVDRLRPGIGSRKTNVAEEPAAGQPVLILTGSLGIGSLVVRYPSRSDERRLQRLLRREERRALRGR